MDEEPRQGRTNYDWVNGMRIGAIVGGVVGLIIGWALGIFPFLLLVLGAGAGGFVGARTAQRW